MDKPRNITNKRVRKPKARHRDVILGAMEELLLLMQANDDADDNDNKPASAIYVRRFRELMDELKRSGQ